MLFLFNNPKWANTTKRLITFRLLSLIPVTLIIITTILNYVSKMNNWNIPLWFAYLINTGRPQISILCILYLFGLYILRVAFKLRYGTDNCKKYFNGNRYMIYKKTLYSVNKNEDANKFFNSKIIIQADLPSYSQIYFIKNGNNFIFIW